jgi:hypothetical protein
MPFSDKSRKATYMQEYRQANAERERKRLNISNAKVRERKYALLRAAKDKPCADCGVSYPPYVMDLDHLRDKVEIVGRLVAKSASYKRIQDEIAKCEVVCSNCHRERTHRRWQEEKNLVPGERFELPTTSV